MLHKEGPAMAGHNASVNGSLSHHLCTGKRAGSFLNRVYIRLLDGVGRGWR